MKNIIAFAMLSTGSCLAAGLDSSIPFRAGATVPLLTPQQHQENAARLQSMRLQNQMMQQQIDAQNQYRQQQQAQAQAAQQIATAEEAYKTGYNDGYKVAADSLATDADYQWAALQNTSRWVLSLTDLAALRQTSKNLAGRIAANPDDVGAWALLSIVNARIADLNPKKKR